MPKDKTFDDDDETANPATQEIREFEGRGWQLGRVWN